MIKVMVQTVMTPFWKINYFWELLLVIEFVLAAILFRSILG